MEWLLHRSECTTSHFHSLLMRDQWRRLIQRKSNFTLKELPQSLRLQRSALQPIPHHLHRICWPIVENSVIKNKPHQFYKLFLRLNLAWLKTLLDCPEIHRMFDDFWVIWNPQCNRIHGIQERRCICMILHEKREEVVPSHDEERQSKAEDLTFWLLVPFWFLVFSHFVDRFWIWVPSVFSWKLNV